MKKVTYCIAALPLLSLSAMAEWSTDFSSASQFDTDFPTKLLQGGGNSDQGNSSISVDTGTDQAVLLASNETGGGLPAYASMYSAGSLSSEFDFISGEKTISLVNSDLDFSGGGSTYRGVLGIYSEDTEVEPQVGSGDGFYLFLNFFSRELALTQRIGGNETVVWTQDGEAITGSVFSLPTLSITLSATDWEISGETDASTAFSGSGSFDTPFTGASWGSDFHLGVTAASNASSDRSTEYRIDSISSIPEPQHFALGIGVIVLMGLIARRRRKS